MKELTKGMYGSKDKAHRRPRGLMKRNDSSEARLAHGRSGRLGTHVWNDTEANRGHGALYHIRHIACLNQATGVGKVDKSSFYVQITASVELEIWPGTRSAAFVYCLQFSMDIYWISTKTSCINWRDWKPKETKWERVRMMIKTKIGEVVSSMPVMLDGYIYPDTNYWWWL